MVQSTSAAASEPDDSPSSLDEEELSICTTSTSTTTPPPALSPTVLKERKQTTNARTSTKENIPKQHPPSKKAIPEEKRYRDDRMYCVCKTPYDETKFYVGCDLCNDWFHGACIGITEEAATDIDEYICEDCRQQKENVEEQELYCLCRQPYDDMKFYIGCDFCQDWFHGKCVGITQAEASSIEEYKCPNCRKKNDQNLIELKVLSTKELDGLKRLHRA